MNISWLTLMFILFNFTFICAFNWFDWTRPRIFHGKRNSQNNCLLELKHVRKYTLFSNPFNCQNRTKVCLDKCQSHNAEKLSVCQVFGSIFSTLMEGLAEYFTENMDIFIIKSGEGIITAIEELCGTDLVDKKYRNKPCQDCQCCLTFDQLLQIQNNTYEELEKTESKFIQLQQNITKLNENLTKVLPKLSDSTLRKMIQYEKLLG